MADRELVLRVRLTSHHDALPCLLTLVRRKSASVQQLTFESALVLMSLEVHPGRAEHLVAAVRQEVHVIEVERLPVAVRTVSSTPPHDRAHWYP